jgi:hypothetical protein
MAKGAVAKEEVTKKIAEAFGQDFVGVADKKIYVFADDGGERVQIAISMTCPKKPLGDIPPEQSAFSGETPAAAVGLSDEEKAKVDKIMEELGL